MVCVLISGVLGRLLFSPLRSLCALTYVSLIRAAIKMTQVQGLSDLVSKMSVWPPLLPPCRSLSGDALCGSVPSIFVGPWATVLLSTGKIYKFRKFQITVCLLMGFTANCEVDSVVSVYETYQIPFFFSFLTFHQQAL